MKSWLVAHRGITLNKTKDNSIEAFKQLVHYPVAYVELDIQVTKDGVAIACHDPSINGLSIAKTNFSQLKKIDNDLAAIEEVFDVIKKVPIIFDLKADKSSEHIHKYLNDNPKSCATSFTLVEILNLSLHNVDMNQTFIAQHITSIGLVNKAMRNNIGGISVNKFFMSPWLYKKAVKNDLKIMIYTINSPPLAKLYRKLYPKALICTDRPDLLKDLH